MNIYAESFTERMESSSGTTWETLEGTVQCVERNPPLLVMLENVVRFGLKGGCQAAARILGSDKSGVFAPGSRLVMTEHLQTIVSRLEDKGYVVVCCLLQPRQFGIPQRRLRLYITASFCGMIDSERRAQLQTTALQRAHQCLESVHLNIRPLESFLLDDKSAEYHFWDRFFCFLRCPLLLLLHLLPPIPLLDSFSYSSFPSSPSHSFYVSSHAYYF
jgi:hypothetical protein